MSLIFMAAAFGLLAFTFFIIPFALIFLAPVIGFVAFIKSHMYREYMAHKRMVELYERALHVTKDIPSPPPVAVSIEGARYRDMLSDVIQKIPKVDPIPIDKHRFEHVHMVASIGHGKTQTMQYFVGRDLQYLGSCTIIVIDSQGEMIKNILNTNIPKEKIVYINPRDFEYPPALQLFSNKYDEQNINATIEIYEYIMSGIFGAELTSKQGVVFRFVIRLMLEIPNATIDTLLQVFEDQTRFQPYINKLHGPAKDFLNKEFGSNQFRDTRQQVIRRIYTIMENQTLYQMFSHNEDKLDMAREMDSGKIILIDTAKDVLKEEGSRILGRFFIAKIVQAAQERGSHKFPVHVYVDEAQDYFDEKTEVFLSQLRKQKVGGFFTHQYLDQLPQKLQAAFMANTNTKIVGGVSLKDARSFAGEMRVPPEFLTTQPVGTFVAMVKGMKQAMAVEFPFFEIENAPKRFDWDEMIDFQRENYCVKRSVFVTPPTPDEPDDEDGPSSEL